MAIKKAELRPKLPDGTYNDIVYLKTSVDMVDGLNIKNNLIETVVGSALDATQGKTLNDKINALDEKISWKAMNYKSESDSPSSYGNESSTIFMYSNAQQTFAGYNNCVVKTYVYNLYNALQVVSSAESNPIKYRMCNGSDIWTAWQQITTINDLSNKTFLTSGGGSSEYYIPTKPSDYTSDTFTVRRLHACQNLNASSYGYWATILGLRSHGERNCFELGFTDERNIIFRGKDGGADDWLAWQQIATTTKTYINFPFSAGYATWVHRPSVLERDSTNRGLMVLYVTKSDGSDFAANQAYSIGMLPSGYTCKIHCDTIGCTLQTLTGGLNGVCGAGVFNNTVTLVPYVTCKLMIATFTYSIG